MDDTSKGPLSLKEIKIKNMAGIGNYNLESPCDVIIIYIVVTLSRGQFSRKSSQ